MAPDACGRCLGTPLRPLPRVCEPPRGPSFRANLAIIAASIETITPGMFAASHALIGCPVGGILSVGGVLLGVRMGRRFRELLRVKCEATNWELTFEKAGPVRLATCTFEVDLFNEGNWPPVFAASRSPFAAGERGKKRQS